MGDRIAAGIETRFVVWLGQMVGGALTNLSQMLLATPTVYLESEAFHLFYGRLAALSAILLMLVLLWYAVASIAGLYGDADLGGTATRLLLAALGTWATPALVGWLTGRANDVAWFLAAQAAHAADRPLLKMDPAVLEVTMVLFLVLYVFFALRLVLFFAYRQFALVALVALAPFVCLLGIIPGQAGRVMRWAEEIGYLLTTQMVHALQFMLLWLLTVGPQAPQGQGVTAPLLFTLGGLAYMSETPSALRDLVRGPVTSGRAAQVAKDLLTFRYLRTAATKAVGALAGVRP